MQRQPGLISGSFAKGIVWARLGSGFWVLAFSFLLRQGFHVCLRAWISACGHGHGWSSICGGCTQSWLPARLHVLKTCWAEWFLRDRIRPVLSTWSFVGRWFLSSFTRGRFSSLPNPPPWVFGCWPLAFCCGRVFTFAWGHEFLPVGMAMGGHPYVVAAPNRDYQHGCMC